MAKSIIPKDVYEEIRRILNCDINKLSGIDLNFRESYERSKRESEERKAEIIIPKFQGSLREHLYDFEHGIETNEMRRDFYLKNRLNYVERQNVIDVFKIMKGAAIKKKLAFGHAVLGVGSSTFSDKYYCKLEADLLKEGITREDYVIEETWSYGDQFSDFNNYKDYLNKYTKENSTRPFDEQLPIVSEEKFIEDRGREQKEYKKKKKFGDILDRKGEDLDFIICSDGWNEWDVCDYTRNKMKEFQINFESMLSESGYEVCSEQSYLAGSDYEIFDGIVSRSKEIGNIRNTCRVVLLKGRNFHFYFEDRVAANSKIRDERIRNYYFAQLVRRSNYLDLKDTINYGNKTGIYENPEVLKYLKKK